MPLRNTLAWTLMCGLMLLGSTASGADKIESAFGKKLGDKFELGESINQTTLTNGTPMYEFKPEKPFRSFTNYYVLITPTTHQIYSIWGMGDTTNEGTGKKEQALLMEILQQKYGEADRDDILRAFNDTKRITQGHRNIVTKVTGFSDASVEIRYTDNDLAELAEKERLVLESKKVDSSGL